VREEEVPLMKSEGLRLEIPKELSQATRLSADELRREIALHLFEEQKLSFGKARELAQMPPWEFLQLLGSRGICLHYDIEEYEEDLKTLRTLRS
jgi:predicted HTH domain antitoxin